MTLVLKLKKWIIESNWKIWVVAGAMIIIVGTLFQEYYIRNIAQNHINSVLNIINQKEISIKNVEGIFKAKDEAIDNAFKRTEAKGERLLEHGFSVLDNIHNSAKQQNIERTYNQNNENKVSQVANLYTEPSAVADDRLIKLQMALQDFLDDVYQNPTDENIRKFEQIRNEIEKQFIHTSNKLLKH